MDKSQQIGKFGENIAEKYLLQNNYAIIERNYRCKYGEVDIIAYDKNKGRKDLVFVEVKTRSTSMYGDGIDAIDKRKQWHIYKSAEYYLYEKRRNIDSIRIDCIEIFLRKGKAKLKHYNDIIYEVPCIR